MPYFGLENEKSGLRTAPAAADHHSGNAAALLVDPSAVAPGKTGGNAPLGQLPGAAPTGQAPGGMPPGQPPAATPPGQLPTGAPPDHVPELAPPIHAHGDVLPIQAPGIPALTSPPPPEVATMATPLGIEDKGPPLAMAAAPWPPTEWPVSSVDASSPMLPRPPIESPSPDPSILEFWPPFPPPGNGLRRGFMEVRQEREHRRMKERKEDKAPSEALYFFPGWTELFLWQRA